MASVGQNWECAYCRKSQVISNGRHDVQRSPISVENWVEGKPLFNFEAIICTNTECRKMTLTATIGTYKERDGGYKFLGFKPIHTWHLLPSSCAKPQPDCIPKILCKDYYEACAIRDLSPKAAATLIRRCLQGMIRNFCGIAKDTLNAEIDELKKRVNGGDAPLGVQVDTVDAIDKVRKIGNIGAHMEKNIDVIVDIDPGEAQVLIELTELLFDEWYIAKDTRDKRLKKLEAISAEKALQKKLPPPAKNVSESES